MNFSESMIEPRCLTEAVDMTVLLQDGFVRKQKWFRGACEFLCNKPSEFGASSRDHLRSVIDIHWMPPCQATPRHARRGG
jgi:hypothetical protein